MLTAPALGVDERAEKLLNSLAEDRQQVILQALQEGLDAGTVRNPSAYVASAALKPSAHGVDDRASEVLRKLPKQQQREVLNKLKNSQGVNNPSAWVVNACTKKTGGWQGDGWWPDPTFSVPLDDHASQLLNSLPLPVRTEILNKAVSEASHIRNPSAWVARAALSAGAIVPPKEFGTAAEAREHFEARMYPPAIPMLAPKDGHPSNWIDDGATKLLETLPEHQQLEIYQKLTSDPSIRNPSAWVSSAALKAGATPQEHRKGNPLNLDARATQLLQTLPNDQQEEILNKLAMEGTTVRNSSAWVVKAAIRAGATTPSQADVGLGKGGKGFLPY